MGQPPLPGCIATEDEIGVNGIRLAVRAVFLDHTPHLGGIQSSDISNSQRRTVLCGQVFNFPGEPESRGNIGTERYDPVVGEQTGVTAFERRKSRVG